MLVAMLVVAVNANFKPLPLLRIVEREQDRSGLKRLEVLVPLRLHVADRGQQRHIRGFHTLLRLAQFLLHFHGKVPFESVFAAGEHLDHRLPG